MFKYSGDTMEAGRGGIYALIKVKDLIKHTINPCVPIKATVSLCAHLTLPYFGPFQNVPARQGLLLWSRG